VFTLRMWHKTGKFLPSVVTPLGWRLYAQSTLEEIKRSREEKQQCT
jgi:DNA-binding transcriptional MerR regulator